MPLHGWLERRNARRFLCWYTLEPTGGSPGGPLPPFLLPKPPTGRAVQEVHCTGAAAPDHLQADTGNFIRIRCLLPAAPGGIFQRVINLIADQATGIGMSPSSVSDSSVISVVTFLPLYRHIPKYPAISVIRPLWLTWKGQRPSQWPQEIQSPA